MIEKKYVIEVTEKHKEFNEWLKNCPIEWGWLSDLEYAKDSKVHYATYEFYFEKPK